MATWRFDIAAWIAEQARTTTATRSSLAREAAGRFDESLTGTEQGQLIAWIHGEFPTWQRDVVDYLRAVA